MSGIILVGGKGKRLRDVAPGVPKPLVKVAGQPFLHWVIRWVAAQGETHIVLAAGHMADQVTDWAALQKCGATLQVAVEPERLGTGGALIFAAKQHKADHYLAMNGDTITLVSLKLARDWLNQDPGLDGIIIAKMVADASRFGLLDVGDGGLLRGFREKQPGSGWINTGIYLLKAHLLAQEIRPMSMEFDCFPRWLREGARIGVMTTDAGFLDIGTPETLAQTKRIVEDNQHILDDFSKLAPVRTCV